MAAPANGAKLEANFAPWHRTIGLDLISAPEDENIHGVTLRFEPKDPNVAKDKDKWLIEFYPYTDGFAHRWVVGGFNDFLQMSEGLCAKWNRHVGDNRPCGE